MLKAIVFILATFVVGLLIAMFTNNWKQDNHSVGIDGYEHGTVICNVALMINHGHYNDPEVKQLIAKAAKECK